MTSSGASREAKETARTEAFSDGVFAIAITLLVLDLKVPREALERGELWSALLAQWPVYFAFATSFATILVMWVNHHEMFNHIDRIDRAFLFLNGFLLFCVTVVPFPTSLLGESLRTPDERTAALVYASTFLVIAIAFNVLWRYASSRNRLLHYGADSRRVDLISRQYALGLPLYAAAILFALVWVTASVVLCFLLAVFFALIGSIPRIRRRGAAKALS